MDTWKSARILVERVVNGSGGKVDTLVYPLIYNYRHYLELRLKEITLRARQLFDDSARHDDKHSLMRSWSQAKEALACNAELPSVPDLDYIDHVLEEFDRLDSGSYTFRYATDKKQETRTLPWDLQHINVRHFARMIERAAEVLDGVSTHISVLADWRADFEASVVLYHR